MLRDALEISNNAAHHATYLPSPLIPIKMEVGGCLGRGSGDFCFMLHPFSLITWLTAWFLSSAPLCSSQQFDADGAGIRPLMGASAGLGGGM